jgi:hypothetical protein
MFKNFVVVTGALDFLIGVAVAVPALRDPTPESFTAKLVLGAFLCFAAAALIWAAQDLPSRAPIVFWQGMVRLVAVLGMLYAVGTGLEAKDRLALCIFDGAVCAAYFVGCVRLTGVSPVQLFLGRTA